MSRRAALFVRRVPGSGITPVYPDVYFCVLSYTQIDNVMIGDPMGPDDTSTSQGYFIITNEHIDEILNNL